MQFPGKLQNLEFVLFVKLYSMGIASNISILVLCVLMRASVAPPFSQCFLLKKKSKPSEVLSVSPNLCVCLTFLVTWCYFYVKYLLGQYRLENVKPTRSNDLVTFKFTTWQETSKACAGKRVTVWVVSAQCFGNVCLLLGSYTPTGFADGSGAVDSGREGNLVGRCWVRLAAGCGDSSALASGWVPGLWDPDSNKQNPETEDQPQRLGAKEYRNRCLLVAMLFWLLKS